MLRHFCWMFLFCALTVGTGCSSHKETPLAEVSGEVKYGGKAVSDGEIIFADPEGKGADTLPIKDGAFAGKVKVGKRKVQIYGYRLGKALPPGSPGAENGPPKENYLPAKYHNESKLTEEVKADQPNVFKYELKGS